MYTELLNNLIYPIITTSIGAVIPIITTLIGAVTGGLFAYIIAKQQYSRDRLNEAIGFIFLLKKTADRIAKLSKEMSKDINKFYAEASADPTEFLNNMFKKHLEIKTSLSQLIQQWETRKESVFLCGSKLVCQDSKTRENIETFENVFSDISFNIQLYKKSYKSFKKKYDNEKKKHDNEKKKYDNEKKKYDNKSKEKVDIHSFLNSKDSKGQFKDINGYLTEISDSCKKISDIYNNIEIV